MTNKVHIVLISEVRALRETTIQSPNIFQINASFRQLRSCVVCKLRAFNFLSMSIQVKPSFMITLNHKNISFFNESHQKFYYINILWATINVVAAEDVILVVFHLAKIFLKTSITTMNVTNDMNFLPLVHINRVIEDLVNLKRLQYSDARRNLLSCKPGIHIINDFFRNVFICFSLSISFLTFLNRKIGHVYNIDSVPILFSQILVLIHFRSFRIGRINNSKLSCFHSIFKNVEHRIPNNLVICLRNIFFTIYAEFRRTVHDA